MSRDRVIDSLGRIDDDMIENVNKLRQKPRRKRAWVHWVAAAACLAVLAVSAEASNGFVSNLLAPLYGGAQTELIDRIGVPVGASVTVAGYTLTADAIIGDRYNFAIVYTLCREDGQPMPEDVMFAEHDIFLRRGVGAGSGKYIRSEDGMKYHIVEQWTSGYSVLVRGNAKTVFSDLVLCQGENTEMIAEGTWELNFAVRYKDTSVKVPIKEVEVTDPKGYSYQIHRIRVSPIGLYIELTSPVRTKDTELLEGPMIDFPVSVILSDDSRINMDDWGYGASVEYGDDVYTQEVNYGAFFKTPIPLDTIRGIEICGAVIDVDLP